LNGSFGEKWLAPAGWKRVFTTGCFMVTQFNFVQLPFMAFAIVPIAVTPGRKVVGSWAEIGVVRFLTREVARKHLAGEEVYYLPPLKQA
jgi:hypothetical protein